MVIGTVKTNKANDTKYIYLAKDCGFRDGQEVNIKNSGIGIYKEADLKKYVEENKELFDNIKNQIKEIKSRHSKNFFETCDKIGEVMGYGELEWDEELYFKECETTTSPYGDMDGNPFELLLDSLKDIEGYMKDNKITKEQVKKEFIEYSIMKIVQLKSERMIDARYREETEAMKKLGFENVDVDNADDLATTLYTNGLVQVYYHAEGYSYNKMVSVTTMRELDGYNKSEEPIIEI